jgi:hypothetical protein
VILQGRPGGRGGDGGQGGQGGGPDGDIGGGCDGGNGGNGGWGHEGADANTMIGGEGGQPGTDGDGVVDGDPGAPGIDAIPQPSPTTVRGGGNYYSQLTEADIYNCTIIDNTADETGRGGGEYYEGDCVPVFNYCRFENNAAERNGGGIYFNTAPLIIMNYCDIIDNNSLLGDGGGIWHYTGGTLTLNSCDISGNTAWIAGGGISGGSVSGPPLGFTLNIDDANFSGNNALFGGGIYLEETLLTIDDADFSGNSAFEGAGLWNYDCSADIRDCVVMGNSATKWGGGFSFINGAASIKNSVFNENDANNSFYGAGGALFFEGGSDDPNEQYEVTNCIITNNTVYAYGGGLSSNRSALVRVNNCTFAGNKAVGEDGVGGAINSAEYWSWVDVNNCILWDNYATAGGSQIAVGNPYGSPLDDPNGPYADVNVMYSDVQGGAEGVWLEDESLWFTVAWWMGGNIDEDPLFAQPTTEQTYFLSQVQAGQLEPNSPCVDAGFGTANALEQYLFTQLSTRTDLKRDSAIVDMGYHYRASPSPPQYSLTIEVVNDVGGSLSAEGGGDDAFTLYTEGDPNTRLVNQGTVVSLQAVADAGYAIRWMGTDDDNSVDPNNSVVMNSDKIIMVEFYQYTLTIEVYTGGDFEPNGTIIAGSSLVTDPFTLTARDEPNSRPVTPGITVNLSALADASYRVWYWSGTDNDGSTSAHNEVTMDSDKTVAVAFEPDGLYYLTVHIIGNGMVTPSGRTLHAPGEVVTLTAAPTDPTQVVIWSGTDDDFSESYQNTITMHAHTDVYAQFYSPRTLYVPGEYPTIQAAIDDADDRDIIELAATGADQPYVTSGGYWIIDRSITITSSNPDDPCVVAATVIERDIGDNGWGRSGFYFLYVGRDTVLNGLTLRRFSFVGYNGLDGDPSIDPNWYDGVPGEEVFGGAIVCYYASPTIKNCIIRDCNIVGGNGGNGATGNTNEGHLDGGHGGWPGMAYGGAIAIIYNSSPLLVNCTFMNNSAIGGNGGDGGNGAGMPGCGLGGRGGGYYYSDPPFYPYLFEFQSIFPIPYNQYTKFSGHGGAVYVGWENSSPEFIDCNFMNNTCGGGTNGIFGQRGCPPNDREEPSIHWKIDNFGGAAYVASGSTAKFEKCSFTNNFADSDALPESSDPFVSFGGAVAFEEGAEVTFENCTFTDNAAAIGGGIYASHSDLQSDDCNFVGNFAYHGGGALCVGGKAVVTASDFSNNVATATAGKGAGICLLGNNADIIDCIISNNDANGSGGGIYLSNKDIYEQLVAGENSVLVKNCLINDNSASRDGGGISANWHSDPNIVNCTIANNVVTGTGFGAGYGGGLGCFYGNYTNVVNSIFRSNSAQRGPQIAIGTGFEYLKMPSTVNVSYSDVQSGQSYVFVDEDCTLNWNAGNIHINPLFATGPLGDFYLSQIAAGQAQDSPCVNTGGSSAASLGLDNYTTRTDEKPDVETVDMGYHYPFTPEEQPCRFCELVHEGIINFKDFAVFVSHWLDEGCNPANQWCQHADVTFDTYVDFRDVEYFARCWLVEDTYPPTPNPSEWATEPYSSHEVSPNSISMATVPAVDAWDYWGGNVQYYFDCVYGGCQDSGWQDEPNYTDPNLLPGEEYGYRVRARDASEKIPAGDTEPGNKTEWSLIRYAIVGEKQPDVNPPEPNKMTWAIPPMAIDSTTITMTATTATDETLPIEYFFECTSDAAASSTWQLGTTYNAAGLTPQTEYTFRVKARDGDPAHNETDWSDAASATTLEEGGEPNEPNNPPQDNEAPLPDPSQWVVGSEPTQVFGSGFYNGTYYENYYWHTMTAVVTSDAGRGGSEPCMYYFDLVSGGVGTHDSGWQASEEYTYPVSHINPNQFGYYRVKARDAAGNETVWSVTLGTHDF